jgi:hypothetical protein
MSVRRVSRHFRTVKVKRKVLIERRVFAFTKEMVRG